MSFTVAIDGPAAAGKGTIARGLAQEFGLAYLDTGLLYRATGAKVAAGMAPLAAATSLTAADLSRGDLRSGAVGKAASRMAAKPEVRAALLDFQKAFARRPGGAVLDGRDIGTVVCPEAEVKLFVTASDRARAHRRWQELVAAGEEVDEARVLADLRERDRLDESRDIAPLVVAPDALLLDTTEMTASEALQAACAQVRAALDLAG